MNLKIGDQVVSEIGPAKVKIKSRIIEIDPSQSKPYLIQSLSPDGVSRTERIDESDIIEKVSDD